MILGITPARGGSKGIPRKNLRMIAGKPLLAWTIDSARKSSLLDHFVISTEDTEIDIFVRSRGVDVVRRPFELATDQATSLSVLQHALSIIHADIVVLLQCTSPVRADDLIDRCISHFLSSHCDSLATGYYCGLYEWGTYDNKRRQELNGWFHDDGSVYVLKAENIMNGNLWGEKHEYFFTPRSNHFEIDEEFDFWVNEQILNTENVPL